MKEFTLEVIRRQIEFSKGGVDQFRECARRNWSDESFRHIYLDLASIFEGYEMAFELILLLERVELSRPFSPLLEAALASRLREDAAG